jgi:hypothetical protein
MLVTMLVLMLMTTLKVITIVIIIRKYDDIVIIIMIICQHHDFKDSCNLIICWSRSTTRSCYEVIQADDVDDTLPTII